MAFGEFPKCLGIWEISQMPRFWEIPRHLRNFQNFKNTPPSNAFRNLEISQMPILIKL